MACTEATGYLCAEMMMIFRWDHDQIEMWIVFLFLSSAWDKWNPKISRFVVCTLDKFILKSLFKYKYHNNPPKKEKTTQITYYIGRLFQVSIDTTQSAFLILLLGISMSAVLLFIENAIWFILKRKQMWTIENIQIVKHYNNKAIAHLTFLFLCIAYFIVLYDTYPSNVSIVVIAKQMK